MDISRLENLDEKSLFIEVMKRPCLYVGSARLDYIKHFVSGFTMCQSLNTGDIGNGYALSNYEMQRWLLTDQSIIIRHAVTVNAWTLFFRCFGSHEVALTNFARYLHADIPKPDDENDFLNHPVPQMPSNVSLDVYNLSCGLNKQDKSEYGRVVIELIKEMLQEECGDYDLLRIYIKREDDFCQIRFIYHTPDGWKDDTNILSNPANYHRLIKLHACVECMEDIELQRLLNHGDYYCTFNNEQDYDDLFDISHTITDKISYHTQYQQWKNHMSGTY